MGHVLESKKRYQEDSMRSDEMVIAIIRGN